jgi:hypothetical protein
MQEQLAQWNMSLQKENALFRTEAAAQCEGRAQDRQIYQEAYAKAEKFYEQRARSFAQSCEGFVQGEIQEFLRRQSLEETNFRRLKEHEIQKAYEHEMRAKAAINQEVSLSQERHWAKNEAVQVNSRYEAAVAQVQKMTQELFIHQQRHEQLKADAAIGARQEEDAVRQREAKWSQEYQIQKNFWEQECLKFKIESQVAQSQCLNQGQQTHADQRHLQETCYRSATGNAWFPSTRTSSCT